MTKEINIDGNFVNAMETHKSLGEITKKFELSQKYFEVIKELSDETRSELLEKDFFNKLFN